MEKDKLEIGDELIANQYGNYTGEIIKITRVTDSSAFCDYKNAVGNSSTTRFKRTLSGISTRYACVVGGGSWSPAYYLVTDTIRKELETQREVRKLSALLSNTRAKDVSEADRKTLIEMLSKYTKS